MEKEREKGRYFSGHIILYTNIRGAAPFYFYWKLFFPFLIS